MTKSEAELREELKKKIAFILEPFLQPAKDGTWTMAIKTLEIATSKIIALFPDREQKEK